jgi:Flp pilus assembly protein TadD
MARISLRAYNSEIEAMIDRNETDEAIIHCRSILEYYSKHVDTYRLMGKALLEAQRFSDASDVFHRVLSSVPDDFIAHLGMSIIREDEGNMDGAIWHMERSFEVQPSNAAIQVELRRLYGVRDGLTPQKIQLTRGALARMSAKSNLYSQAIAAMTLKDRICRLSWRPCTPRQEHV